MEDLRNINEDALFLEIGKALHQGSGVLGFENKDYIKLGKKWFDDNKNSIKEKICTDEIKNLLKNETDSAKIITIIADTISTLVTYVPIYSLATLIAKIGAKKLCNEHKEDS